MNDLNAALRFLNPHLDLSEARQLMWDDLMTRTHDIFRESGPDVTRRFGYADIPGGRTDATTPSTEEQYPTGSPENAQQVGDMCLTTPNYPVTMNDNGEAKRYCNNAKDKYVNPNKDTPNRQDLKVSVVVSIIVLFSCVISLFVDYAFSFFKLSFFQSQRYFFCFLTWEAIRKKIGMIIFLLLCHFSCDAI